MGSYYDSVISPRGRGSYNPQPLIDSDKVDLLVGRSDQTTPLLGGRMAKESVTNTISTSILKSPLGDHYSNNRKLRVPYVTTNRVKFVDQVIRIPIVDGRRLGDDVEVMLGRGDSEPDVSSLGGARRDTIDTFTTTSRSSRSGDGRLPYHTNNNNNNNNNNIEYLMSIIRHVEHPARVRTTITDMQSSGSSIEESKPRDTVDNTTRPEAPDPVRGTPASHLVKQRLKRFRTALEFLMKHRHHSSGQSENYSPEVESGEKEAGNILRYKPISPHRGYSEEMEKLIRRKQYSRRGRAGLAVAGGTKKVGHRPYIMDELSRYISEDGRPMYDDDVTSLLLMKERRLVEELNRDNNDYIIGKQRREDTRSAQVSSEEVPNVPTDEIVVVNQSDVLASLPEVNKYVGEINNSKHKLIHHILIPEYSIIRSDINIGNNYINNNNNYERQEFVLKSYTTENQQELFPEYSARDDQLDKHPGIALDYDTSQPDIEEEVLMSDHGRDGLGMLTSTEVYDDNDGERLDNDVDRLDTDGDRLDNEDHSYDDNFESNEFIDTSNTHDQELDDSRVDNDSSPYNLDIDTLPVIEDPLDEHRYIDNGDLNPHLEPNQEPHQESHRKSHIQPHLTPYLEPQDEDYQAHSYEQVDLDSQDSHNDPHQETHLKPHQILEREPHREPHQKPHLEPHGRLQQDTHREKYIETQRQARPQQDMHREAHIETHREARPQQDGIIRQWMFKLKPKKTSTSYDRSLVREYPTTGDVNDKVGRGATYGIHQLVRGVEGREGILEWDRDVEIGLMELDEMMGVGRSATGPFSEDVERISRRFRYTHIDEVDDDEGRVGNEERQGKYVENFLEDYDLEENGEFKRNLTTNLDEENSISISNHRLFVVRGMELDGITPYYDDIDIELLDIDEFAYNDHHLDISSDYDITKSLDEVANTDDVIRANVTDYVTSTMSDSGSSHVTVTSNDLSTRSHDLATINVNKGSTGW